MNNKKNYYEVLGVKRGCSAAEIRTAYHKLARKYHPDVTLLEKSYAAYMMAAISEAYKVLSDDAARAAYDAELDRPPAPPQQPPYEQRRGAYGGGSAYGAGGSYSGSSYGGSPYGNTGGYDGRSPYGSSSYGNGSYGNGSYGNGSYGGTGYSSGAQSSYGGSYDAGGGYCGAGCGGRQPGTFYEESRSIPDSLSGRLFYVLGLLGAAAVNVFRQDPLIRKVVTAFAAVLMLNLFMSFIFFMSGSGKSSSDPQAVSGSGSPAVSQDAGFSSSVSQTVKNSVENYKDNIKGFASGYTDSDFYKFAGIEPYMPYATYKSLFPEIKLSPIDRVLNVSRYSCNPAFGPPFKGFPPPSSTILGFDSSNRLCMVTYFFSPDDFTQVKNYYYAALGPFLKHKDTYFFKRGDFVVMLDPYSSDTGKASLSFCVDIRNILKED